MDLDKLNILMGATILEDLEGTKSMDMEYTPTRMAPATLGYGKREKGMEKAY